MSAQNDDSPFTPLEESVLAIEREFPTYSGRKDDAIRSRLDLSPIAYYQVLNTLMERPEAMEHEPQVIGRLHRARAQERERLTYRPEW